MANKRARSRRQSAVAVQLPRAAARAAALSAHAAHGKGGGRKGAHAVAPKTRLSASEAAALLRKAETLARCRLLPRDDPCAVGSWVHNLTDRAALALLAEPDCCLCTISHQRSITSSVVHG